MKLLTTATILLPLLTLTIGTPLTNTAVNLTSNPLEPADGSWIHLCKSHKCSDIHTPCMTHCGRPAAQPRTTTASAMLRILSGSASSTAATTCAAGTRSAGSALGDVLSSGIEGFSTC
ncbi:hypothetical protein BU24DRAFT_403681 [Aaosphaeria arxii CBS 175.79]|uniref:Uncharacterized protein n=1 Tax=Aaosphaeria arxii CBS 175.79 TaxID=1450172 RepID=A0A6A5Y5V9_9PLEO|nr:uncharacterized protein BU24DRAFT_403681 [Aaosphaeria arxii CBS 175.79]KAF2020583.1 hypothetical protein BU24DRAFT_403681 [Aaosphaeria arxii CBS 175.79]